MLFPINSNQISKLIPAVGTGSQFKFTLGNPRKVLQRVIVSSIGGFITLIISSTGDQTNNFWLLLCVVFFLFIIWGPILEASRKNLQIRKYKFFSIFDGYVSDIYKTEKIESSREQTDRQGRLEVIENKLSQIRVGSNIRCLLVSNNRKFDRDFQLTDAWLPEINLWVGEYPYLLRPAFKEICYIYIN